MLLAEEALYSLRLQYSWDGFWRDTTDVESAWRHAQLQAMARMVDIAINNVTYQRRADWLDRRARVRNAGGHVPRQLEAIGGENG